MIFWMIKKSIGDKELKPTGLKSVIEILSSSTCKHRKGEIRTLFWVFGISREDGEMKKKVLPKLQLLTLRIYIALPIQAVLTK